MDLFMHLYRKIKDPKRKIMRLERSDNVWELIVLSTALIVALLVAYWTGKI
jgi:hypothetical protein